MVRFLFHNRVSRLRWVIKLMLPRWSSQPIKFETESASQSQIGLKVSVWDLVLFRTSWNYHWMLSDFDSFFFGLLRSRQPNSLWKQLYSRLRQVFGLLFKFVFHVIFYLVKFSLQIAFSTKLNAKLPKKMHFSVRGN